MQLDPHKSAQLKQDWLVVSERFGDLAQQERLLNVGAEGFARIGRGAVFLFYLDGKPRSGYGSREHVIKQIGTRSFKDSLLEAIQTYHPQKQVVVIVSFDDLARVEDFTCQYFGLGKG